MHPKKELGNPLETSTWEAQQSGLVTDPGTTISSPGYSTDGWFPALVPGTVLSTLVANGVYEDPFFGTNNDDIPDISEQDDGFYTYWFRTRFDLPSFDEGTQVWLDLRGINYTATLFMNGQPIDVRYKKTPINTVTGEPLAKNEIQGMFLRHAIEITDLVVSGVENVLAIQVQPPNPPGTPGGNGGGPPNIGNNVTMRYTVGWDWIIPIRDRNTGIWDQIAIYATGPVRLRHPHVQTFVLDSDGNLKDDATVNLAVEVQNASDSPVSGKLYYQVEETGQQDVLEVELQAGETRPKYFPALTVNDPRLWWPNGYGSPELYSLSFSFVADDQVSDQLALRFGIREFRVTSVDVPASNASPPKSRKFAINGQPIFIRGANWIGTDAMLRQTHLSAQRYRDEIQQMTEANLNLLRVWGGGIAERPEFYEACDALGMLVMQDFWISGEYNPRQFNLQLAGRESYPLGYDELFESCARDTIRMLRNHPSLCFWSGGNENEPPSKILDALRTYITGQTENGEVFERPPLTDQDAKQSLDPTRILVPKSTSIANDQLDDYDDGPYGILDPKSFFTRDHLKSNPFNPELGSVGTPIAPTLRSMMSSADANDFPKVDGTVKPCTINPTWCLHDFIPYINPNGQNLMAPYGYPTDLERFGFLAQILNFEQYRALFEGYTTGMWSRYTGVLLWKGQNPWQGLRGSLHDWLLDTTGGLFGVRAACEPVHVQLNLDDDTFLVVNTTATALTDVTVTASLIDLSGTTFVTQNHTYPRVSEHSLSDRVTVDIPGQLPPVYLLVLELNDAAGLQLSRNLYWRSGVVPPSFLDLNRLPEIVLDGSVEVSQQGDLYHLAATVANPSSEAIAFFIRLEARKSGAVGEDARVLPSYFSDNYFTLLPGELRSTIITCRVESSGGEPPELWAQAWNVPAQKVSA